MDKIWTNEEVLREKNISFEAGAEHKKSSEETIKKFKTMEDKIDNLGNQLNEFEKKVIKEIAEMPTKILKEARGLFASKRVELIVYGMVAMVLIAVGGFIIDGAISNRKDKLTEQQIKQIIETNYDITE